MRKDLCFILALPVMMAGCGCDSRDAAIASKRAAKAHAQRTHQVEVFTAEQKEMISMLRQVLDQQQELMRQQQEMVALLRNRDPAPGVAAAPGETGDMRYPEYLTPLQSQMLDQLVQQMSKRMAPRNPASPLELPSLQGSISGDSTHDQAQQRELMEQQMRAMMEQQQEMMLQRMHDGKQAPPPPECQPTPPAIVDEFAPPPAPAEAPSEDAPSEDTQADGDGEGSES